MATSTIQIKSTTNSSSSALSSVSSSTNSSSSSSPSIQAASTFAANKHASSSSYKQPHQQQLHAKPPTHSSKSAIISAAAAAAVASSAASTFDPYPYAHGPSVVTASSNKMHQAAKKLPVSQPQTIPILKYDAPASLLNSTTASFVSSASSSCRFERNYSYIEAMRSGGPSHSSNKTSLLTNSGSRISNGNAEQLTSHTNGTRTSSNSRANGQIQEEVVAESQTPKSNGSATKSNFIPIFTSSKHGQVLPISIQTAETVSHASEHHDPPPATKRVQLAQLKGQSKTLNYQLQAQNQANMKASETEGHLNGGDLGVSTLTDSAAHSSQKPPMAKSASQSSILAIFKNTFSPFTIRKWRSKSRDKIASSSASSAAQQSKLSALNSSHKPETTSNGGAKVSSNKASKSRAAAVTSTSSSSSKYYSDTVALNGDAEAYTFVAEQQSAETSTTTSYQYSQHVSKRSEAPRNDSSSITITVENAKPISIKTTAADRHQRDLLVDSNSSVSISSPLASSSSVSVGISPNETGVVKSNQIELKLIDSNNNKPSNRVEFSDYKQFVSNSESVFNNRTNNAHDKKTNSTLISASDYLDSGLYSHKRQHPFSNTNSLLINTSNSSVNNNNSGSNRQLSYIKLSCLVNGYDAYSYKNTGNAFQTNDENVAATANPASHRQPPPPLPVKVPPRTTGAAASSAKSVVVVVESPAPSSRARDNDALTKKSDVELAPKRESVEVSAASKRASVLKQQQDELCVNADELLPLSLQPPLSSSSPLPSTQLSSSSSSSLATNEKPSDLVNADVSSTPFALVKGDDQTATTTTIGHESNEADESDEKLVQNREKVETESRGQSSEHHHLPTPPVTPPLHSSTSTAAKSPTQATIVYDGNYFIKLLDENTNEINKLCKEYKVYLDLDDKTNPNFISNEEIVGQLQTTIGKAQLLINQKFKQFRELCNKNLRDKLADTNPSPVGEFVTRDDDLAGFWDMVCLQIDDIHKMFNLLDEIRKNDWNLLAVQSSNQSNSSPFNETGKSTNGNYLANKTNGNGATKKTVTSTNLVKKRIATDKKSTTTNSSTASSPTSTITIESSGGGDSTALTNGKSASQLKAEAARQRLMEAKKNAFKQKKEAEERLLKQQQELNNEAGLIATSEDNQFFSISS